MDEDDMFVDAHYILPDKASGLDIRWIRRKQR